MGISYAKAQQETSNLNLFKNELHHSDKEVLSGKGTFNMNKRRQIKSLKHENAALCTKSKT